jgi:ABC-type protease/lipase transport system fused ATPase/permease subunit
MPPETRRLPLIAPIFCISLLDRVLQRDLFESVVIGLLVILGVHVFTPILPEFVKTGQLLAIQRAVRG